MKLINTIEINPFDYRNAEYESPNVSLSEFPEQWNEFWKRCLSDKNLGNLCAIRKGSWLVDIETINDNELEEILRNELNKIGLEDFRDRVSIICGGIVVEEGDDLLIEPTCCGDIGNIVEWEGIFESESNDWTQLWIGHPWLFYRKENGYVEFSDYTDLNLEDFKDIKSKFQFLEEALKKELENIRNGHNKFESRIRSVLDKMVIDNSGRISKLMTGND